MKFNTYLLSFSFFLFSIIYTETNIANTIDMTGVVNAVDMTNEINISIKLNPSGYTLLSALLTLAETNKTGVLIMVQGKEKKDTIGVFYPPNTGVEFPVHGLYANYTNIILVKIGKQTTKAYRITTPALEITNLKKKILMKVETTLRKNILPQDKPFSYDLFFTSVSDSRDIFGFDKAGDIRYSYSNPDEKPTMMRMQTDGKDIFMLYISGKKRYIKRDLIGREIFNKQYQVHHDAIPYLDNLELILGNSRWGWEDQVFELDSDKNTIKNLSLGDLIRKATSSKDQDLLKKIIYDEKNIYTNKGKLTRIDWAHANSLVYDEKNDRLYVSLRHLGVLAIKYKDWELEWFMVSENLKTSAGVKYGKKPAGSLYLTDIPSLKKYRMKTPKGYGPRGQHALLLKKNGNLLLFDNRSEGATNTAGSRILEYRLNHNRRRARVEREFVDNDKTYSHYVGDVDLSGQDHENILIFYGHTSPKRLIELDADNKVLFNMEIEIGVILDRIDKFPLYPYRDKNKIYTVDYLEE